MRNTPRLYRAFFNSVNGLKACFVSEAAFRQELMLSLIAMPLGAWLGADWGEKFALVVVWILVLATELFNTAVERIVDLVSPEPNELAREAKDIASTAVFIALIFAFGTWIVLLGDQVWALM